MTPLHNKNNNACCLTKTTHPVSRQQPLPFHKKTASFRRSQTTPSVSPQQPLPSHDKKKTYVCLSHHHNNECLYHFTTGRANRRRPEPGVQAARRRRKARAVQGRPLPVAGVGADLAGCERGGHGGGHGLRWTSVGADESEWSVYHI